MTPKSPWARAGEEGATCIRRCVLIGFISARSVAIRCCMLPLDAARIWRGKLIELEDLEMQLRKLPIQK